MATTLDEYMARIPEAKAKAIRQRAAVLIKEEASLRQLRERVGTVHQAEIASKLGISQSSYSKLERRTDVHVRTLARVIHALGGELEIVVKFPDAEPVRITQFSDLTEGSSARR
jgi:transcriptional regulator with XRE-family HTH domain